MFNNTINKTPVLYKNNLFKFFPFLLFFALLNDNFYTSSSSTGFFFLKNSWNKSNKSRFIRFRLKNLVSLDKSKLHFVRDNFLYNTGMRLSLLKKHHTNKNDSFLFINKKLSPMLLPNTVLLMHLSNFLMYTKLEFFFTYKLWLLILFRLNLPFFLPLKKKTKITLSRKNLIKLNHPLSYNTYLL